jgi:hypothetical protein
LDLALEGPRGALLRSLGAGSVEEQALVLFATVDQGVPKLYLDKLLSPTLGTATLGALMHEWFTAHLHAGTHYLNKKWRHADLSRVPQAGGGTMVMQALLNGSQTVSREYNLDLGRSHESHALSDLPPSRCLQLGLLTRTPSVGLSGEVLALTLQVDESDKKGNA